MKKYLLLFIAASLAASVSVICIIGKSIKSGYTGETTEQAAEAVSVFCDRQIYTVKEYNGKIGIFEEGEKNPFTVLDTFTFILPDYDRDMLKDGFTVDGKYLYGIIEDYTG